jgi:hypothetical protein
VAHHEEGDLVADCESVEELLRHGAFVRAGEVGDAGHLEDDFADLPLAARTADALDARRRQLAFDEQRPAAVVLEIRAGDHDEEDQPDAPADEADRQPVTVDRLLRDDSDLRVARIRGIEGDPDPAAGVEPLSI